MNPRSIRFRLTAWYSAILAASLIAFGALGFLALKQSLFHAVDEALEDRVAGVRHFMEEQTASLSAGEIRDEFREHSVLGPGGDLFQVCDAKGVWLYRSAALENAGVTIQLPGQIGAGGEFTERVVAGALVRFHAKPVQVLGKTYTIQVASPVDELVEGMWRFQWTLVLAIPALLSAAAAGGWWLSHRALAPVDAITAAARSIEGKNLDRRLPVGATDDELQRLSTTLNQMLDRIEGSFERVRRFTADASHELRTPIALVRTSAELALRKPRSEEEYRDAMQEILNEAERTTELLEGLLSLARADAGKASLELTNVDASEVLREAGVAGKRLAERKGLAFEMARLTPGLIVRANREALRRLLLILIDNAVKYTPADGKVNVEAELAGGKLEVAVRDNGCGIRAEDSPYIFERFYRADSSRNRDSGGVGLGLALAEWIATAHETAIQVETQEGQGSTFRFRLEVTEA
jgi:heavy metal sensor kinase